MSIILNLKKANNSEIVHAAQFYHYARKIPSKSVAYSVYEGDTFCGVIIFGSGANSNIGKQFQLIQGQIYELVRVALNDKHQLPTSKILSVAMRLFKKEKPLCKMLVSYADTKQGHTGVIYQATNWKYMGLINTTSMIDPQDGIIKHRRSLYSKYDSVAGFTYVTDKPKHKYVYFFDKSYLEKYKHLFKQHTNASLVKIV